MQRMEVMRWYFKMRGGGAEGYEVVLQDAGGWIDEVLPAGREKFERC